MADEKKPPPPPRHAPRSDAEREAELRKMVQDDIDEQRKLVEKLRRKLH